MSARVRCVLPVILITGSRARVDRCTCTWLCARALASMPSINGHAYTALICIHPGIPVILITGSRARVDRCTCICMHVAVRARACLDALHQWPRVHGADMHTSRNSSPRPRARALELEEASRIGYRSACSRHPCTSRSTADPHIACIYMHVCTVVSNSVRVPPYV